MRFYFINTDKNSWVAWDVPNEAKLITQILIETIFDDLPDGQITDSGDSVNICLNQNQINHAIHMLKELEQAPSVTSFIDQLELLKKSCSSREYGTA